MEKDRVLHATILFTGAATNWIQPYLCAAQENQNVTMLANHGLFMAKITCVFGVYNKVATAKQNLKKLHQLGNAHAHCGVLTNSVILSMGRLGLSYQYYKGLKNNMNDCIFNQGQPESLNKLINMAIRINDRQHKQ